MKYVYDLYTRHADALPNGGARIGVIRIATIETGWQFHVGDIIHLLERQMVPGLPAGSVRVQEIEYAQEVSYDEFGPDIDCHIILGVTTETQTVFTGTDSSTGEEISLAVPSILESDEIILPEFLGEEDDGGSDDE